MPPKRIAQRESQSENVLAYMVVMVSGRTTSVSAVSPVNAPNSVSTGPRMVTVFNCVQLANA